MKRIVVPHLGEGIEEATVAFWHVNPGDRVKEDDDIVELVTDKATFHVPAGMSGLVQEIRVPKGQDVKIGETLALIEEND